MNGDEFTASTTEEMIEMLLNLGLTANDLRFTADDHALTVGQMLEIRCALKLRNYIPQESENHGLEAAVEPPNSKV